MACRSRCGWIVANFFLLWFATFPGACFAYLCNRVGCRAEVSKYWFLPHEPYPLWLFMQYTLFYCHRYLSKASWFLIKSSEYVPSSSLGWWHTNTNARVLFFSIWTLTIYIRFQQIWNRLESKMQSAKWIVGSNLEKCARTVACLVVSCLCHGNNDK